MKQHLPIIIVLLAFLGLAGLYSAMIPLGEGPDEQGHAAYVFFLAREGRLPVQRAERAESDVPGEGHQPPLAYALAAPLVTWLPLEERKLLDQPGNRRFTWAGGNQVNAVAHGTRERWPWNGTVLAWHLARLASVVCGAATVGFTYLAARALEQRNQTIIPLLAALLIACNPQFLFSSALVSNDALLAALSALLLWLVAGQPSSWRVIVSGGVLGLALITKQSAFALAPIALLGCWWAGGRDEFWQAKLRRSVLMGGAAAVIAGWWYVRNWQLYGDPLAANMFRAEFTTQAFEFNQPSAWLNGLVQLHESFWARFGWMNVPAPEWAILLITLVEIVALAGLAISLARRSWKIAHAGHYALILLPVLALAWVIAFAMTVGLVAWQGRLLFMAMPAIAILLARGLAHWAGQGMYGRTGVNLLISILAGLAIWLPFGTIQPAYPWHVVTEEQARARIGNQVYGRFAVTTERGAELLGWRLDGQLRPGATIYLTLTWHALGPQDRDWVTFIHLVDSQEQILAEDNRESRNGAFPMTHWVAGDWVESTYPLKLPETLAPGSYDLRVGLYYPRTNRRAGVFSPRGKLRGDFVRLTAIQVQP